MCGITGIYAFNLVGRLHSINLAKATQAISSRGPDFQNTYTHENVGLGHRRLAIIDTSYNAHQPMIDESGRYVLVYNGEIYNFRQLRQELKSKGINFRSESDTEVLLQLLIRDGIECLNRLNGFFAFAFYDSQENSLWIARDRYGIKPLFYLHDQDKLIFASEMKSIFEFGIEKKLDLDALTLYLQLNYLPAPYAMLQNVQKLEPGHFISIINEHVENQQYYTLPEYQAASELTDLSYDSQKKKLREILEQSVVDRLYSDVPLGAFLSGGIDSSVIAALAARHTDKLHTFSVGYRDEPYFDETDYAIQVSKHLGTEHTIFKLSNRDLFDQVFTILDYLDEPFADSSAIAVNILSRETRKHVTVALSGDGADELFGGYNKHRALYRLMHPDGVSKIVSGLGWLWNLMPKSRNSSMTNGFRQMARFSKASHLEPRERYWLLATFLSRIRSSSLLSPDNRDQLNHDQLIQMQDYFTAGITETPSMAQYLQSDIKLVLPNDMLAKVDLMSMAHGLEVRVPFLDQGVVEFALSLPDDSRVNSTLTKRILKDTFRDILPRSIYNRPKRGFEVPLLKWLRKDLRSLIWDDLLVKDYIEDQGIFNYSQIYNLKRKLGSSNPEDSHATIWALVVFQWWYRKYFL